MSFNCIDVSNYSDEGLISVGNVRTILLQRQKLSKVTIVFVMIFYLFGFVEICAYVATPSNGNIQGQILQPLSGDKVSFSCNARYDLVGKNEIFCIKGSWNGSVPACLGK